MAFMVTLLVAALAAASVNAATSSQKATKASGKGWELKAGHKGKPATKVGTGQFKPTAPHQRKFINSPTPANANAILQHDRGIPGQHARNKAPNAQTGPNAPVIPHAHSLPISHQNDAGSKTGLTAFQQEQAGGYIDTPPDQGLAEGNGFVFEAVNNSFQILDTNFG